MKRNVLFGMLCIVGAIAIGYGLTSTGECSQSDAGIWIAGNARPWLRLAPERALAPAPAVKNLRAGEPRSLAKGDFDHNAVPDIVVGTSHDDGGLITIYLGTETAYPTRTDTPPFDEGVSYPVDCNPDYLATGDFDADGFQDLVVAEKGGLSLEFFAGSVSGGLQWARSVAVDGAITAVASGEVNRRDGLTDLVVGISAWNDAKVLVFQSLEGALDRAPEVFAVSAPPAGIAIGRLDGDQIYDIAAAAGSELVIIRGRDRRLSSAKRFEMEAEDAAVDRLNCDRSIVSLAAGAITGHREDLALLTDEGRVMLLSHRRSGWQIDTTDQIVDLSGSTAPQLVTGRITSLPRADLMITHGNQELVQVINFGGLDESQTDESYDKGATTDQLIARSSIRAILPVRLNIDALDDLVVLTEGDATPKVLLTAPVTTYDVNATDDTDDGVCNSTHCSLREAINLANSNPGLDTITFSTGWDAILLTEASATIGSSLVIDGLQGSFPFVHQTHLSGELISGVSGVGFKDSLYSSDNTIADMIITGFGNDGMRVNGHNNYVTGCRIGITLDSTAAGNGLNGIRITGYGNVIGGSSQERNVISANDEYGIGIIGNENLSVADDNTIIGNYVGTDSPGTDGRFNHLGGILIQGGSGNMIGTTSTGNVISGNVGMGVRIAAHTTLETSNNLIVNNLIGVDVSGNNRLSNSSSGVLVATDFNTIGGTTTSHRNIISGNQRGVYFQASGDGNLVQGNFVGLGADGQTVVGNTSGGVKIEIGDQNTIGGSATGAGNVISGNGADGIHIVSEVDSPASLNEIHGNLIGTDASGMSCLGNADAGIRVNGSSTKIGAPASGNIISCNGEEGIRVENSIAETNFIANGNSIRSNLIGVAIDGSTPLGNLGDGVCVWQDVTNTTIGGGQVDDFNTIANNGGAGVDVGGGYLGYGHEVRGNSIFNNSELGIDLRAPGSPYGVTANDLGDGDVGPNGLQNFPVITGFDPDTKTVSFSLSSAPNSTYDIEIFAGSTCDASGYGEGETLIGNSTLSTDASGQASGSTVTNAVNINWFLTARVIDSYGSASEFSQCFELLDPDLIFADDFETSDTINWGGSS